MPKNGYRRVKIVLWKCQSGISCWTICVSLSILGSSLLYSTHIYDCLSITSKQSWHRSILIFSFSLRLTILTFSVLLSNWTVSTRLYSSSRKAILGFDTASQGKSISTKTPSFLMCTFNSVTFVCCGLLLSGKSWKISLINYNKKRGLLLAEVSPLL